MRSNREHIESFGKFHGHLLGSERILGYVSHGDDFWMRLALSLAERGRGFVEPNPLVGAVLVRDEQLVGEGWHDRFGGSHAEVNAIAAAGPRAAGSTLYVTLEPCCHHGKTPPCTDAITKAGIRRVVAAMPDPFERVSGQGIVALRDAGIAVDVGCRDAEARFINRPYLTLVEKRRPYIHLKWAMTLDGKIATKTGDSKWISSDESRRRVHELRGRMDAIIVGANTVRTDDPLLTARPPGPRTAVRIVLASKPDLPAGCQLLQTASTAPVIVVSCSDGSIPGIEILAVEATNGRPSVSHLMAELGRRRMTNVLVEGGANLFGSFLDAHLVDEVHVFIAGKLLGGATAPSPVAGFGIDGIANALQLSKIEWEACGPDVYIHGYR